MIDLPPAHLVDDLESALDADPPLATPRLTRDAIPRELLGRSTIGELLGYAADEWVMILALWTLLALVPWIWPVTGVLVAGRLHALGVILHDAAHLPLRRKDPATRLLEAMAGWPLATTLDAMRYHHLRHHRDNGMPSDPYFKAGLDHRPLLWWAYVARGIVLIPFWFARPFVGVAAWLFPAMRNVYGRVWLQDKSGEDLTDSREVATCGREEVGQLAAEIAVFGLGALMPWPVLVGWLAPAVLAGVIAAWRLLVEHRYVRAADRRVETILATTRDHHLAWHHKVLLGPRNIGYHVVHHLHPQAGLASLPRVRAWYVAHHGDVYPPAAP
jgi:fatty acid desaturase